MNSRLTAAFEADGKSAALMPYLMGGYPDVATSRAAGLAAAANGADVGELRAACDAAGIDLVPLVAPTSTDDRIAEIGRDARGFVYTVSTTGTTGERDELPPAIGRTVERVREATAVPVAVGFGI